MVPNAALQLYTISLKHLEIFVPTNLQQNQSVYSPYWAKVWPAALGLCSFLQHNLHYINQKKVAELAAGLGLPSIFAAEHAATVYCSDIEPAAVNLIQQSALHNKLNNVHCTVASWEKWDAAAIPDVVLLSDVNYEPEIFEGLLKVIEFYLQHNCTVILSTPQRLMAKPFIEQILKYCLKQEEIVVAEGKMKTAVSVFVVCKIDKAV